MPNELYIPLLILLGSFSGLLGGLLGIGGGVVTVPALYYLFTFSDLQFDGRVMQVAIGTSLAASFLTSAIATYLQLKQQAIRFAAAKFLLPGLILGSILGAIVAHYLPSELLSKIFGVMALLLGSYFCLPRSPHPFIANSPNSCLSFFGLLIGTLSSLLGIGGGSLAFPILLGYQLPPKNCSATSAGSTCITTLVGSIAYFFIAKDQIAFPHMLGYVELPALLAIGIGSLLSTPIGVKLAHKLNGSFIKRIFGFSLIAIGLIMLLSNN